MKEKQKPAEPAKRDNDLEKRIELLERVVLNGEVDARHELKRLMVERKQK